MKKLKIPNLKKIITNINIDIKKIKLYSSIILLTIGIILFLIIIYFTITDYIKQTNSVTYNATITALNYQNNNYIAQIKYSVEGKNYEKTIKIKEKNVTVNDLYTIKYNKNNPNILVSNNHILYIAITIPLSIILIKCGSAYLIEKRKQTKQIINLKNNGILIYANIDEIFINNKTYKIKGKYPYKIRLKYLNPQDNQIYSFDSTEFYEDIPNLIKEKNLNTLPVYIDRTNTSNYYVDLSSIIDS